MSLQKDLDFDYMESTQRRILFLGDTWSSTREGIAAVNYSLLQKLSRFKGIELFCAILDHVTCISEADQTEATRMGIKLLFPSRAKENCGIKKLSKELNNNPADVYNNLFSTLGKRLTHVVGNNPITSEAALKIRDAMYNEAKVIQLYHVIPMDLEWTRCTLPYELPSNEDLISCAVSSDVTYAVNKRLFWYLSSLFREKSVDLRLFQPHVNERVFTLPRRDIANKSHTKLQLLVLDDGYGVSSWSGFDIAACATDKLLSASIADSKERPIPSLTIARCPANIDATREELDQWFSHSNVDVKVVHYDDPNKLMDALAACDVCLVPSRSEPLGAVGLMPLSAGVPTLMSKNALLSAVILEYTSEPEEILVPVTNSLLSVRQDASTWRDSVLALNANIETAERRANLLRTALKRSEVAKQSYDNLISLCLGGIRLKHEVLDVTPHMVSDMEKELPMRKDFNAFVTEMLKQCWRLKHDPLTRRDELIPLIPGFEVPFRELTEEVTNRIESMDRQIVEVEPDTGSFVIYCPTTLALMDLWAMCDVINHSLYKTLLADGKVFRHFLLKDASVRTLINGPEFLQYKKNILKSSVAFMELIS